jgi:hypothetical protein
MWVLHTISVGRVVTVLGAGLGLGNGGVHGIGIVAVYRADHIPTAGAETGGRVVNEPGGHLAVDGNAVVVVQRHQLVQLPGTGQGHCFVADAFHQATVAQKHVGAVVHHLVTVPVELGGQQLLGQRHAHRVGDALPQRAGGGLHTRCDAHFRMASGFAVQFAEVFQLVHRQLVAGEMQQRVNQHRSVAVAQHKTVAVGPGRIGGVVAQVAAPQRNGHVGHAHGRTGVAGIGGLHSVHREGADGVGHVLVGCGNSSRSRYVNS